MQTAQVINEILDHGRASADDSLKVIPKLQPGEFVAQGDLNFWVLDSVPSQAVLATANAQLAIGNTKGSRHCVRAADLHKVRFYKWENPSELEGPILELLEDVVIEHPEHGDQQWPGGTIIAVTYQLKHGDEVRRVAD